MTTFTNGTDTANTADAYMVTGAEWASGTIEWANMPAANTLLQSNISHNNLTGYTFSCLSAVQSWYNGDTTGQNANYGIMLRYYDETVADYNAVYSADYTDEAKRPTLTITYQQTAGIIADGVYYIKNANVGLYLGTDGSIADNTSVQLFAQATSGLVQVRQLWKIAYLGNGYYSIRPLHKLDMGLHVTSNSVDITTTYGTGDTLNDVTSQNRWGIEATSDGKYYINNVGTSSMALKPVDGAISPGMDVTTAINSGTSDSFKWEFVAVDDLRMGVVLYHTPTHTAVVNPTRYITEGEICTLADYNLSPMIYSGEGLYSASMQWTRTGTSVNVVASTGTVTGLSYSEGSSVITGSCEYGSVQFTVKYLEITEGTYFLQNMETEQFADASVDEFGSGTTIVRKNFNGANTQRWVLDHLGDGTYTIRIGASETPYYLSVQADSISNGAVIMLRPGPITDGMRWKFQSVVSGKYYKVVPASGELGNMALTAGENCLQQMQYVDATYSNKWTIHKHKDYSLMYIGETEGEEEIKPVLSAVDSALKIDAGMDGYAYTSMTKEEMKKHLSSCKIFSCVTHGEPTYLKTSGGDNFSIADVNALADDAFDNLQLVYMGACLTGQDGDGADNLVNALYDKGADVLIGFKIKTDQNETYIWTEAFMKSIAFGNTVETALDDADGALLYHEDLGGSTSGYTVSEVNRHIRGSIYAIPCP